MRQMRTKIDSYGLNDDTVMSSDDTLQKLNDYETQNFPRAGNQAESQKAHSEFSLDDLKSELSESFDAAIQRNLQVFDLKFTMFSEQLESNKDVIITVIREGPYEKVKDPVRFAALCISMGVSSLMIASS